LKDLIFLLHGDITARIRWENAVISSLDESIAREVERG